LNTYVFGNGVNSNGLLDRVALDVSAATSSHFFAWDKVSSGMGQFRRVNVSDGAFSGAVSNVEVVSGGRLGLRASQTAETFGFPHSCPFFLLPAIATTTTFTIRRQRRFLLPSSDDNKRISIPTLELLMRTGIGLTPAAYDGANVPQGANPQVMLRISKDGGVTWGPERWRSAGTIGKYLTRARWLQATGNYRQGVCEITVSDPVSWQMLAAMGEPVEGSS
jgi:hypothetical protein